MATTEWRSYADELGKWAFDDMKTLKHDRQLLKRVLVDATLDMPDTLETTELSECVIAAIGIINAVLGKAEYGGCEDD